MKFIIHIGYKQLKELENMKHYILKNVKLIHVEDGTITHGGLEVKDGHIGGIFSGENIPADVETIDLDGKYVLPGLIDMHCHIKEGDAPLFVVSGVTTVRNTAGNVIQLKELIDAPIDAPTPRIYSADRMIDGPPGLWGPTNWGNFVTDDPDAGRSEVRRQAEVGAKFIKVYGWLGEDVMLAVVQEAKKYNLEVSCDLFHSSKVTALDAARIGVTWFEHASGFAQALYPNWYTQADREEWEKINWENPDEQRVLELCKEMLSYNVKLCPTMVLHDQSANLPDYWNPNNDITSFMEEEHGIAKHWGKLAEEADSYRDNLGFINNFIKTVARIYHDLGGTVVAGTDSPAAVWTYYGMALHRELELFVEIGFTELEALQAATIRAAQSINLEKVGMIEKGGIADLVVLDKNPLENISHTQLIDVVIKGGKLYQTGELLEAIPSEAEQKANIERFIKEFGE